ncbi:hypothetical protein AB0E75_13355 [Streptomyces griseoviridis]|uniref:WXG100 family type VII secretion target n=3 Tax=Streptomyces TaxID=1883 RepID=A0ABT9L9G4_STRGD|nr:MULTISPECIES: hypothetical protein [Streptomyces]MDP9680354.1 hypothetical protein [Streptomyces griseoviridis]GGS55236.1 hypothetical protein GCM10010238_50690 [Streptomyces niveoruber]GGT09200.1 hypothetical protein GCM10010240_48200 [Streptomyces griseoviridis]GGU52721.1 hypothetical protein GCM10010259_49880 [Streptomyces daghestanicus]GHI29127.1 hypothetical protein Sdagh_08570 [Streptomyces daghestanicus]
MADGDMFAALPDEVQRGGDATDQVARLVEMFHQGFDALTSWDPARPPWGRDKLGAAFEAQYKGPHTALREAMLQLGLALGGAANLTVSSGQDFSRTQGDALDSIHGDTSGDGRR